MEIIEEETGRERYGICPRCGHKINFCGAGYMGTFECDCGQWYNIFGQAMKPPEEWGGSDVYDG